MIKSGSIGSLGLVGSGHFLTFLMDWGPNFEWNTFLKFENPSTGSKVRDFQSFLSKTSNFGQKIASFDKKTQFFGPKFKFLAKKMFGVV